MLAGVLVLLCLVLLLAELRLRGRRGYAPHRPRGRPPGPAGPPSARSPCPPSPAWPRSSSLALGVPLCEPRLLDGCAAASTALGLGALLSAPPASTLALAAAAAVVVTAHGAAAPGWLAVRARGRVSTLLERSTYLGSAVPGIVVALALVTLSIRATPWLYQTVPVLLAAYAILFLPARRRHRARRGRAVAAALRRRRRLARLHRRRTGCAGSPCPLLAPGLGAGAALVFLAVVTELTATLLLAPTGTTTLATAFWSASSAPGVRRGGPVRRRHGAALAHPLPCCCPATPDGA